MNYLVTAVTFGVFFIEAMLHFTIGNNTGKSLTQFQFICPSFNDLMKILSVLAIFSILNGYIVHRLDDLSK